MIHDIVINSDTISILYMMYNTIDVEKMNDIEIYTCSNKENRNKNLVIIYKTLENTGLQYDDIENVSYVNDTILLNGIKDRYNHTYKLVLVNASSCSEIASYENTLFIEDLTDDLKFIHGLNKSYLYSAYKKDNIMCAFEITRLHDDVVALGCEEQILIYSLSKQSIIDSYDCKCSRVFNANSIGNFYRFINFGNSGLLVDITTQEVIQVIKDNKYIIKSESLKSSYCDIVILTGKTNEYMHKGNYFICGRKVLSTDEYLKHLTIKNITPVTKKNTGEIKHYRIETYKGLKGILSKNFRILCINNVLAGENILDSRFEFIKEKYLT